MIAMPADFTSPPYAVASQFGSASATIVYQCKPTDTTMCAPSWAYPPQVPLAVLRAAPGETLRLAPATTGFTPGTDVQLEAKADNHPFLTKSTDPASLTLPDPLPDVSYLSAYGTADDGTSTAYELEIDRAVPPTPPVAPPPVVRPGLASASAVKLRGGRVAWTVTCPKTAAAACAGTVSVRVHGLLAARKEFSGLTAGHRLTMSATQRPVAKRYLRKHRNATLRGTVRRATASAVKAASPHTP